MRTMFHRAVLALPMAVLLFPAPTFAQWRYPPMIYPGYPAYRYAPPESDLKIDVTPKDASVYVDGYFAGKVDQFDGAFQRLHVLPGQHEIVIYLAGYRSLRQQLYLSPSSTRKIEGALERLAPGEPEEAEPRPSEPPQPRAGDRPPERRGFPGRRVPPPPDIRPDPGDRPEVAPPDRPAPPADSSRFGTMSIRVQPAGATILIDGERWDGPTDDERLIIQVTRGGHTIEAEKDGYRRFVTEIEVTGERTVSVNISLSRN